LKLGVGAEIAAVVGERCFDTLKGPIRRIGTEDLLFPAAVSLQEYLVPTVAKIGAAVSEILAEAGSSRVRKK
jgi:pyruvate dehydrogenase E1 component beta subunit